VVNLRVPGERGGLRERKKLAVRRALGSAAVRLAAERGLENVTIEDITAEAGVSLRTFGNYFSSKYEAICALGADRARRIGADLLARPAGEPLWEALVNAVLAHYEGADQAPDTEWLAGLKLVLTAPAIRGEYLKVDSEMQQALAEVIAARTGIDMEQDMYPQVLAGAVTAAAQVAVRRWAAADPPVPLRPLLRRALDQLATACSGDTGRWMTEEQFKALVRPVIFGPNGPLCEPPMSPGQLSEAALPNPREARGGLACAASTSPHIRVGGRGAHRLQVRRAAAG
jgi:AcrR family transcriptional regulator